MKLIYTLVVISLSAYCYGSISVSGRNSMATSQSTNSKGEKIYQCAFTDNQGRKYEIHYKIEGGKTIVTYKDPENLQQLDRVIKKCMSYEKRSQDAGKYYRKYAHGYVQNWRQYY